MNNRVYSVGEFAEMIGKSVQTLQRWDREGILTAYRSPSKRRYYTESQYNDYMGITKTKDKQTVMYCRVSTKNQKDDLNNQMEFLQKYAINNGYPIHNVYTDYGSGLNYKRKNWNKLIDDCFEGKIDKIIISYSDRFVRFGFEWIRDLLKRVCDVDIIVVENRSSSPTEELVNDIISILDVFSCRVYDLRKYKNEIKEDFNDHKNV